MKVLMFSGGLDSTILFYDLLSQETKFECVFVSYNQKNVVPEVAVVQSLCDIHRVPLKIIHAENIFDYVPSSLLKGRTGEHTVASDEVPNRNATLACIAASNIPYPATLLFAAHKTEAGYADATPQFYTRLSKLLHWSTNGKITCEAPYIRETKKQIIKHAWRDLALTRKEILSTVSCYEGDNCGRCPACRARKRALEGTPYEI